MASTIRCISQHAEEVYLSAEESVMVPAGDFADGVDLKHDANQRLVAEGLIIEIRPSKKSSANNDEGGST